MFNRKARKKTASTAVDQVFGQQDPEALQRCFSPNWKGTGLGDTLHGHEGVAQFAKTLHTSLSDLTIQHGDPISKRGGVVETTWYAIGDPKGDMTTSRIRSEDKFGTDGTIIETKFAPSLEASRLFGNPRSD